MTITQTTGDADLDAAPTNRTPESVRPAFLDGIRHGRYPLVPDALAVAVDALDRVGELEREAMNAKPEGLGPFCQRVAADVLAGKGYPKDFAAAAFEAQQAADRLAATALAVHTVRRMLSESFATAVAKALPELLGGLRARLAEVMSELLEVDQTIGALDMSSTEAVAAASDEQRAALLAFGELKRRYNVLRMAQRDALEASALKPPGVTDRTVDHGWRQVFETAVHEVSEPRKFGRPSEDIRSAERFRGLARRPDVWLPTVEELQAVWHRLHPPPEHRVVDVPAYNSLRRSA